MKAVSLGKLHGYGVLLRIEQISNRSFSIEQGALYPKWGVSDNNRRAKYYMLTRAGHARLQSELQSWRRLVNAMTAALAAEPAEG